MREGSDPHRPLVGILADDLTGSADAAAPFVHGGRRALIERGAPSGNPGDYEIRALATAARDVSAADARPRLERGLEWLAALAPIHAFLKVDSTLRGHLPLELELARSRLRPALVLVCPALPAQGRTVRDGVVHVDGAPLDGGEIAVRFALGEGMLRLGAAELHDPTSATRARVAERGAVVVADATGEVDLDALVALGAASGAPTLFVGAAGLAGALARALPPARPPGEAELSIDGPIVIVAGSASERTALQLRALEGTPRLETLELDAIELLEGDARRARRALSSVLAAGDDCAISVRGPRLDALASRVERALGRLVAPALRPGSGLVLTGGATAEAVLARLEVRAFELLDEVEPGVPLARDRSRRLSIVTKAGGFGSANALRSALERLRAARGDHRRRKDAR